MEKTNLFIPFKGIQTNGVQILFGMTRYEIHHLIGKPNQEFKRGLSKTITDYYKDEGLFVLYDINYYCEAIEFANDSNLIINSKNVLEFGFSALVEEYGKKSIHMDIEDGKGVTFLDLGFGVSKIDNTDKIETIIVFSSNYWE